MLPPPVAQAPTAHVSQSAVASAASTARSAAGSKGGRGYGYGYGSTSPSSSASAWPSAPMDAATGADAQAAVMSLHGPRSNSSGGGGGGGAMFSARTWLILLMLVDGLGLALITGCTLYDGAELWHTEFKYNYDEVNALLSSPSHLVGPSPSYYSLPAEGGGSHHAGIRGSGSASGGAGASTADTDGDTGSGSAGEGEGKRQDQGEGEAGAAAAAGTGLEATRSAAAAGTDTAGDEFDFEATTDGTPTAAAATATAAATAERGTGARAGADTGQSPQRSTWNVPEPSGNSGAMGTARDAAAPSTNDNTDPNAVDADPDVDAEGEGGGNTVPILFWFSGRFMQVVGLLALIVHAANLQRYHELEILGMALLTVGPALNVIAACTYDNNNHIHFPLWDPATHTYTTQLFSNNDHDNPVAVANNNIFNKQWLCAEITELIGILLLDLSIYFEVIMHSASHGGQLSHGGDGGEADEEDDSTGKIKRWWWQTQVQRWKAAADKYCRRKLHQCVGDIGDHTVLIAEVLGFAVLECAAMLEFVYKEHGYVPSALLAVSEAEHVQMRNGVPSYRYFPNAIRFRYDVSHCTDGVGLLLLTLVAFGQYAIRHDEHLAAAAAAGGGGGAITATTPTTGAGGGADAADMLESGAASSSAFSSGGGSYHFNRFRQSVKPAAAAVPTVLSFVDGESDGDVGAHLAEGDAEAATSRIPSPSPSPSSSHSHSHSNGHSHGHSHGHAAANTAYAYNDRSLSSVDSSVQAAGARGGWW